MANPENKETVKKDGFATTTTTSLPGLRDVKVIVSQPALIKENSSKISKK